ncbi:MAG: D-alanine--D-alanine ligase [Candidatus Sumerlaeaceae bacterium]|nr:D-alanine--D-alanine ligase [Candidatus Sumerlaeaceae bacterium]
MRKIWLICGGPSTEFQISLSSARVVCEHISLRDKTVRPVVITRLGRWSLAERELREGEDRRWADTFLRCAAADDSSLAGMDPAEAASHLLDEEVHCALLILHGQFGEDGCIQGFLDTLGVPYTGSGVLASALAFDKALTLDVLRGAGLATPHGLCVTTSAAPDWIAARVKLPVFVKPVRGGSSVGMSLVRVPEDLASALELAFATDSRVLVEERVDGVEVSCGVLDLVRGDHLETLALPPTEIRPKSSPFFDYEAKYLPARSEEITPAPLPQVVLERIRECALRAHRALGCQGMSRTDFIVTPDGTPVVLEVNTIPGMTPTSLLPQQAAAVGIEFPALLDALIEHALYRAQQRKRFSAAGATAE